MSIESPNRPSGFELEQAPDYARTIPTTDNLGVVDLLKDYARTVGRTAAETAVAAMGSVIEIPSIFNGGDVRRDVTSSATGTADGAAETRLKAAAEKYITDPEARTQFLQDLEAFKKRVADRGLPESEFTKTLESVTKLLESKDTYKGTGDPVMAARGIMFNAADPERINQGPHGTCGTASLEHKIYSNNPSVAADMVAQSVLDGKWTGRDGQTINMPAESIPPDLDGKEEPDASRRSYASQMFQIMALNDYGQHLNPPMTFVQGAPRVLRGENWQATHYDDYWLLANGEKKPLEEAGNGVFSKTGGIPAFAVASEVYRLTGEKMGVMTNRGFDLDDAPANQRPEGITDDNIRDVRTRADLEKQLAELKGGTGLPMVVCLDARMLVYSMNTNNGMTDLRKPQAEGATHFVTIADYKPAADGKPAQVYIHNQWGPDNNGWITVDQLWESMGGGARR